MMNRELTLAFLEKNIFAGLKNMNDGFDSETIKYFTESDFRIVLERVEKFGLGIYGIEPWENGNMFDVRCYEDYSKKSTDPEWYNSAFNDFIATGEELLYAASYYIPSIDDAS